MPYEPEEWLPDAPVWTPPKSTPQPVQQQPQPGMLDTILGALSWHPDIWGPKAAEYAEPALKYGEQGNDFSHRAVGAAGAFTANFGKLVDSAILNPTNLALLGLSGGSSALAGVAGTTESFAAKQALMRAAQALQFPGKVASGAMMGHGIYRASDENAPWDEKASGVIEAILGGMGWRAPGIEVPKMDVLPAEAPSTALSFPLPRGRVNEPIDIPRPLIGGPAGVALNKPYTIDTAQPLPGDMMSGSGTVAPHEMEGLTQIPPDLAARRGVSFGQPAQLEEWTPPEEPQFERPIKSNKYDDLTPDRYKRYSVYDENDNLIHTTYNYDEAHTTADQNNGYVKDSGANPPQEPSFMRVPGTEDPNTGLSNIAMGGASPKVLDALGTALYSRDRPSTVVKELIQNSADEHREIGQTAPIKVILNPLDNNKTSVTVKDSGRGMTPDELYTKFTDVGETGKAGIASASGGFGFAKAAPMLSGDYVHITSIVKTPKGKVKYTFEGTPEWLKAQTKGVPLKGEVVDSKTPTGLTVKTYFPDGTELAPAANLVHDIASHSTSITSPIQLARPSLIIADNLRDEFLNNSGGPAGAYERRFVATHSPGKNDAPLVDTIKTKGANIKISYHEPPENEKQDYKLHVMNKGLYQETQPQSYNVIRGVQNVPEEIYADIDATVEEGKPGYPFTTNREQLDSSVTEAIQNWVKKNIVSGSLEKRRKELEGLYQSMKPEVVHGFNKPTVIHDPGDRFTPEEMDDIRTSPVVTQLQRAVDKHLDEIFSTLPSDWGNRVEQTGLTFSETRPGEGFFGIHIPNPSSGRSSILINPFLHVLLSNTPRQAAYGNVVTLLHEASHTSHSGYTAGEFSTPLKVSDIDDPRVGEFFQAYLKQLQQQGGLPGHGLDFTKRLAEAFARFGVDKTNEAVNEFQSILTDESGGYRPEVQRILSIYSDSRRRIPTTKDFLTGTGVKQANTRKPKGGVPGAPDPNGDGVPSVNQRAPIDDVKKFAPELQASVEKLKAGIKLGLDARRMQDKLYSIERAKRAAAASSVKTPGLKGYYEQLGMLRGELPKIPSGSQLQQNDVDNLIDAITNSDLDFYKSINAKSGLLKVMTGRAPQLSELVHLNKVFGKDFGELVMLHGGLGAVPIKDLVNNLVNVPKSIMASIDLSAPLRQGLPLIYRGEWWNSFKNMFEYAGSEKAFQDAQDIMMAHPNFEMWNDTGLFIAGIDENLARREEQFLSPIAEQIPGVGSLIRGSERAYVGFLNKLRFDSANALLDEAKNMGHQVMTKEVNEKTGEVTEAPAKIVHDIANFINVSTGRGSLGRFEKNAVELNAAIFSPRMISANLTMMNPKYYTDKNTHPFVRKEALKALLAVAAAGLLTTQLAKRMGGQVNSNATSSDFGKAKFGNTRVDPWRGFQQYVVAGARFVSGKTTNTQGETKELGKGVMPSRLGVVAGIGNKYSPSLMENKLSPIASFIDDMLSGRTYPPGGIGQLVTDKVAQHTYGDKPAQFAVPKRVSGEIINRYTPMFLSDLVDVLRDNPRYIPLTLLGLFGYGVQTFGPKTNPRANQDQQQSVQP